MIVIVLLHSPRGDRVRSRVELTTVLHGTDLTNFEYKTGKFYDGEVPPPRSRGRIKVLHTTLLVTSNVKTKKLALMPSICHLIEKVSGTVLLRVQLDGERRWG